MTDVTFDTETTGLDVWYGGAVPFMVQAADDATPHGLHTPIGPAWRYGDRPPAPSTRVIRDMMSRAKRLVAHNLPFDVHQLNAGPKWDLLKPSAPDIADTDTLARIAWPDRRWPDEGALDRATHGYKLKDLAVDYVDPNAKDGQDELKALAKQHGFDLVGKNAPPASFFKLWELEPEAMEFYAREDVRLTLGLLRAGEARLDEGQRRIWELEQRVAPILIGAERRGICVDQERLPIQRKRYVADAEVAKAELDAALMEGWDQNNDELAEALIKVGVPLTETTDSGQVAVNKGALDKLVDAHPVIQDLYDYRTAEKFVSTYLDHMDHEVIHPTFWQIGAWTGRMAASNPNLQNVPTHAGTAVRELYVPREGMAFVAIDFEQIELRALAYYLNDRGIQELVANEDFFAWVASQVYGGGIAQYRKGAPRAADRQVCKNATYAIVYGAGGLKVGKMVGWPPDSVYTANDWVVKRGYKRAGEPRCKRAEQLVKQIKSILKGYGQPSYGPNKPGWGLQGRISEKVAETGYVTTIMGRKQHLGHDGAWKGLSGLIQGSAADLFKNALVAAAPVAAELGAYPLLFIHDEIVFEAPADAAEEVLKRCGQAMKDSYDLTPALEVEGNIGYKNWGECK